MGLGDGSDGQWRSLWRLYVWPFRMLFGFAPPPAELPQKTAKPLHGAES